MNRDALDKLIAERGRLPVPRDMTPGQWADWLDDAAGGFDERNLVLARWYRWQAAEARAGRFRLWE